MDREEGRRPAGIGSVTIDAGGRNAKRTMVRIRRVVVIGLVTAHTGVGRVVINAARVTTVAINSRVCSC